MAVDGAVKSAGVLASIALSTSAMPTFATIIRDRNTKSRPLLPYSAMLLNGLTWVFYGLATEQLALVIPNFVGAMCGGFYFAAFARYVPQGAPVKLANHVVFSLIYVFVLGYVLSVLPLDAASTFMGYAGCILCTVMFSGPLVAIRQVVSTRSTESLDFSYTVATGVNCLLWAYYGFMIARDPFVWFPSVLGLVASFAQLFLFSVYGFDKSGLP
mmetsp:Transcript_14619/g.34494  ORF Transcript_14619/g.34494 Transcript_14619/m.34494 type:complete len:214 (+) Transcript_14619:22-663(+)